MYRKDYILTMIEELAQFLGRLMFLKETARFEVALAEIEEFSTRLFGRKPAQFLDMTYEEVLAFGREGGMQRTVALGSIMKELGDIARMQGHADRACACHTRALALLLDAYGTGDAALPLEVPERIEILIDSISVCELPTELARPLMAYSESLGFFSDAEDILADLVQAGVPGIIDEGIAFYQRLALRDDTDLLNGNLPRAEVEEGLQALMKMKP